MLEAVLLRSSVAHDAPRWFGSHTKLAYCKTLAYSLAGQKRCEYGFAVALNARFDSLINAYFWHAEELAASRIPAGCISGCPLHSLHSQHEGAVEK